MTGSHTFDVIAAALEEIHEEYKIRGKITRTTTDSGSNFLKAFRIYGEEKEDDAQDAQEEGDYILEDESDESESEVEYQDLFGILDEDCGLEYQLPRHQKCACHLLNLVATVDASAAEAGSDTYKRLSRSAFAKCSALWNKTSRLNTAELGFLAEYATVMKPVAMALNLLQGESSVHMGFLLPTLYQLQDKLKKLESSCKVCQPLLKALHGGILKRFGEVMKEPELIAAAILLPKFRTAWTTNQSILTTGLDYIKGQLENSVENDALCYSSPSDEEDFFASMNTGQSKTGELERYLSCSSAGGMDLLHSFPKVKNLSLKLSCEGDAVMTAIENFSGASVKVPQITRVACNARNPQTLTSTKLRKQIGTLSEVLNLSNTELDQMADFLGHDIRVHRQFYRLPEGTLQLAKMSNIFLALKKGRLADFKGRNLDEIDIDPDESPKVSPPQHTFCEDDGGTLPADPAFKKKRVKDAKEVVLACVLDPRYKERPLVPEVLVKVKTWLKEAMETSPPDSATETPSEETDPKRPRTEDQVPSLLDSLYDTVLLPSTSEAVEPEGIIEELERYFREPVIDRKSGNPYDWWKHNTNRFTRLSALAR
ncbi:zinc finger BED domain-containing 1-like protein [Labeo rohita]|uniref:Zinc finger BED domain-containing 1-like protein n=1 Tax=Labeo rohita TaxID=84645 RepID=A0A498NU32_LABRO|nr:zinc finger BED domain-containing 1-like protein [Labeo rohita]